MEEWREGRTCQQTGQTDLFHTDLTLHNCKQFPIALLSSHTMLNLKSGTTRGTRTCANPGDQCPTELTLKPGENPAVFAYPVGFLGSPCHIFRPLFFSHCSSSQNLSGSLSSRHPLTEPEGTVLYFLCGIFIWSVFGSACK